MHATFRRADSTKAFTLVELLVVIVIIGMLMALLLPAVNAVREAGRRTTCVNSQFQQAFAMNQYSNQKRFIPGWRNFVTGSATGFSWPVMILPNMERKDVYNAIAANPAAPPATYISFFSCPSSPPDALTQPTLAYVGSTGAGNNGAVLRGSGVILDLTATGSMSARVSMDDVGGNDGTAYTLILSEECGPQVATQGSWNAVIPAGNGVVAWNAATPVFGMMNATVPTKVINSGTFNVAAPSAANMPSSNHPGGAVVAFCDGHTGFLKDSLAPRVYAQLMSWNHALASGTSAAAGAPYTGWVGTYSILQQGDYE